MITSRIRPLSALAQGRLAAGAKKMVSLLKLRPFDRSTYEGRSRERLRRAALSALASALARGLAIVSTLISIPLTLHYLGPEQFGMWTIIISFTLLFSFADLGIGNGMLTAIAIANGRDDDGEIRSIVSSGYAILALIGLLISSTFIFVYPYVSWDKVFNVESDIARVEAAQALRVFALCFAVAVPLSVIQRVQAGLQQGFISSLWQGVGNVLGLIGILLAIHFEGGLPWLVLALSGAPLVVGVLNTAVFFGFARPDLRPSPSLVSRKVSIEIARLGALFLMLQLGVAVVAASDNIVISQILGPKLVVQYAVPAQMFGVISALLSIALIPLWPAYGEAMVRGDAAWARRILFRSLVFAMGFAALLSTFLVFFGRFIITLWVGHAVNPPFLLLVAFGIWKVTEACGNCFSLYFNGARVIYLQTVTSFLTMISVIALKIILISRMGINGAVWSTVIPYVCFTLFPFFIFARLRLKEKKTEKFAEE